MSDQLQPKKCEVCNKEVDEWWYVVSSHRPSGKGSITYRCVSCEIVIQDLISQLKNQNAR